MRPSLADEWAEDWWRRLLARARRDTVRERLRIELRLTERDVIAQQGHVAAYDAETENLRRKIHASSTDSHPPVPR